MAVQHVIDCEALPEELRAPDHGLHGPCTAVVIEERGKVTSVSHMHADICAEHRLSATRPTAIDNRGAKAGLRAKGSTLRRSEPCDACRDHPAAPDDWRR